MGGGIDLTGGEKTLFNAKNVTAFLGGEGNVEVLGEISLNRPE